jgi:carboxylesterase type B
MLHTFAWSRYRSWSDAQDIFNNISRAIGCDQTGNATACFLSKPTWAMLNVSDAYYGNATGKNLPHKEGINQTQWGPVVEGNLLPQPPIQMLQEGKVYGGPHVPVLLGSNADEGSTFMNDEVSSKEQFQHWCDFKFGNTAGALVSAHYIKLQPPVDPDNPLGDYNYW